MLGLLQGWISEISEILPTETGSQNAAVISKMPALLRCWTSSSDGSFEIMSFQMRYGIPICAYLIAGILTGICTVFH